MDETVQSRTQAGLSLLDVRRALRIWTLEGSVASVNGNLTGGAFQTGFALYLGCTDFKIGVLAAIPAIAGLLQLVSPYAVKRFGARKPLVQWASFIGRLLWIPIFLIPLGLFPKNFQVTGFLFLFLLFNALMNLVGPLWTSWISDLVPPDYRGRYFGQRNMYGGFVGMVVSILGGYFLDAAIKHHLMSQPAAFACLFGIAALFGAFSFILCGLCPDVSLERQDTAEDMGDAGIKGALEQFKKPFADRTFRSIIICIAGFILSQSIAGQFFTVNQLKYLKLNYTDFQLLAAVAAMASLASMPLLGYLADKYGNKPILVLSCVTVVIPPFLWLLASPDTFSGLWHITRSGHFLFSYSKLDIAVLNTIAGVGWAGIGLTQFNLMIGAAPQQDRTLYVGTVAAVSGIAGSVAPMIGGEIVSLLAGVHFPDHGPVRNSYHVLFILSGFLRLLFIFPIAAIVEKGSSSAGYVLGQLKATKPVASIASIHKLSRASTALERRRAAESLGRLKTPVAVEELVFALDDVALPVREQAAVALGEIGDRRAVAPLIEKLMDQSTGITEAVATALGKIGDRQAFSVLSAVAQLGPTARQVAAIDALGMISDERASNLFMELLEHPDPSVRTAAIRALSRRGDPIGEEALTLLLAKEKEPTAIAAIADGLGRMGSMTSTGPLVDALDEASTPTVRKMIVNALGSVIGGQESFYPMLTLETSARDEMVTRMLTGLMKRYRGNSALARLPHAPRVAIRARQAMDAYIVGDFRKCLHRLASLAELISGMQPLQGNNAIVVEVLKGLDARYLNREDDPSTDEVLLALFLTKELLDR